MVRLLSGRKNFSFIGCFFFGSLHTGRIFFWPLRVKNLKKVWIRILVNFVSIIKIPLSVFLTHFFPQKQTSPGIRKKWVRSGNIWRISVLFLPHLSRLMPFASLNDTCRLICLNVKSFKIAWSRGFFKYNQTFPSRRIQASPSCKKNIHFYALKYVQKSPIWIYSPQC